MKIFLTVDVEVYRGDYEAEVYGKGMGLSSILKVLSRHKAKATFFVEALGATRWGLDATKKICDEIQNAGQEVQLHIHPSLAKIDGFEDDTDVLHMQPLDVQVMLIERGLEVMSQCGVENITCFRAGDFAADENTLTAMKRCGLKISSNRDLDKKCSTRSLLNDYFPVANDVSWRDEIIDVPMTCLKSPIPFLDGEYRHLEISAVSSKELAWGIERLQSIGCGTACVLTHPGELFDRRTGQAIRKNIKRLESFCERYASRSAFMSGIQEVSLETKEKPVPKLPLHLSLGRAMEQGASRLIHG